MGELRCGLADPADRQVAALIQTHSETGRLYYAEEDCHSLDTKAVSDLRVTMFAAWLGNKPVAICGLRPLGHGLVELKSMHTSEATRGKGVATALLGHVLNVAKADGHNTMVLEAGRSDDYAAPARALYRRHGFTECPPFGEYAAREASIFMCRDL